MDGYPITVFSVSKLSKETGFNQSLLTAPIQLVIVWMIHRGIITDIVNYIVQQPSQVVDLDW